MASRRNSYIDMTYDVQDSKDVHKVTTSINSGPVHNAVRRMTELIDLENLEGYFDEFLLESNQRGHDLDDFDALPEDQQSSTLERTTPPQKRFITIESYTKICIERPNDNSKEKQDIPPMVKSKENIKIGSEKKDSIDLDKERWKGKASLSSKVSHLEKNTWREYGRRGQKVDHYDRKNRSKKSWVLKLFCGVNQEFKWYSLKGKGVCLILPMAIFYLVLCVALLPLMFALAAVSTFVLCAGLCSYFSLATKKVGVSSDDESDKSCLEAIWWWA